jgi:hypothetical protein
LPAAPGSRSGRHASRADRRAATLQASHPCWALYSELLAQAAAPGQALQQASAPSGQQEQQPHCQLQEEQPRQQQPDLQQPDHWASLAALLQQWVQLLQSLAPGVDPPAVQLQLQGGLQGGGAPQQQPSQAAAGPHSLGAVTITEVVEVKHTSPFEARCAWLWQRLRLWQLPQALARPEAPGQCQCHGMMPPLRCRAVRSGAKGRLRLQYALRDKGPRQQVPAHWVPQLQLHLLATGCHSLLLLSRRAPPARGRP